MNNRLLFLDVETTGLPDSDGVVRDAILLEVGMLSVQIPEFEIRDETSFVFHFELRPALTRDHHFIGPGGREMFIHRKVVDMHKANGLWAACAASDLNDYQRGDSLIRKWILDHGCDGSVLAGCNPDFDRAFLRKFLPTTHRGLHYRNFDVNSFWLFREMLLGRSETRAKPATHRALDDCRDAVKAVEHHFEFFQGLVSSE